MVKEHCEHLPNTSRTGARRAWRGKVGASGSLCGLRKGQGLWPLLFGAVASFGQELAPTHPSHQGPKGPGSCLSLAAPGRHLRLGSCSNPTFLTARLGVEGACKACYSVTFPFCHMPCPAVGVMAPGRQAQPVPEGAEPHFHRSPSQFQEARAPGDR